MAISLRTKQLRDANPVNRRPVLVPERDETGCKTIIKLPKILIKTMQRRNGRCLDQSTVDPKKGRARHQKGRNILPKKLGALISGTRSSRRKAQDTCDFNSSDAFGGMGEADEKDGQEAHGKNSEKRTAGDPPAAAPTSLVRIFSRIHLRKWKPIKTGNLRLNVKPTYRKIKRRLRLTRDKQHEESINVELCKKRILMGEKCRPINSSGVLHYDKDGIFLPEDVLSSEEC